VPCCVAFVCCSRGGLRILANKAQLQASMPPSKRPRREVVLRYLRQHVPGNPPPPAPEPEFLWSMPTNLLQVGAVDVWICAVACCAVCCAMLCAVRALTSVHVQTLPTCRCISLLVPNAANR
jgi:hypothetical protein